jgi:hypothetical protein
LATSEKFVIGCQRVLAHIFQGAASEFARGGIFVLDEIGNRFLFTGNGYLFQTGHMDTVSKVK